jgi:hypothetical protein
MTTSWHAFVFVFVSLLREQELIVVQLE